MTSTPIDPTDDRLYWMLGFLAAHHVAAETPPPGPVRGVVQQQDALDALFQVGMVLDEYMQSGGIPTTRGVSAAAMLMVARDFIQPLPVPPGVPQDGPDPVTPDLQELVGRLRTLHAPDFPPDE